MIVLIPAYEPDERLVRLVRDIGHRAPALEVVVVDDGSGPGYDTVFDLAATAGAQVVRFGVNRGKGAALKSGFAWVRTRRPGQAVVCADCDGQHTVRDILAVADEVGEERTIVLGVRHFTGRVPLRSRVGNDATRILFHAFSGSHVSDTQTGLRGYPASMLAWLEQVPGDRFEYELRLLLQAQGAGQRIVEVPIQTVYLDENASSHFRPLQDSWRIYRPLFAHGARRHRQQLAFLASSFTGFLLDATLLFAIQAVTGSLPIAVVGARAVSAVVNFSLNRWWVFHASRRPIWPAARRYFALALLLLAGNMALITAFTGLGMALAAAKLLTEGALVVASYTVQRLWVFAARRRELHRARPTAGVASTADAAGAQRPALELHPELHPAGALD